MSPDLAQLRAEALAAIDAAENLDALKGAESQYLGKKGALTALLRSLGTLSAEERPAFGKAVNDAKVDVTTRLEAREE